MDDFVQLRYLILFGINSSSKVLIFILELIKSSLKIVVFNTFFADLILQLFSHMFSLINQLIHSFLPLCSLFIIHIQLIF